MSIRARNREERSSGEGSAAADATYDPGTDAGRFAERPPTLSPRFLPSRRSDVPSSRCSVQPRIINQAQPRAIIDPTAPPLLVGGSFSFLFPRVRYIRYLRIMLTLTIPALRPAPSRASLSRRRELARGLARRLGGEKNIRMA